MDLRNIDYIFIFLFAVVIISLITSAQNPVEYGASGILSEVSCEGKIISARITNLEDQDVSLIPNSYESDLHLQVKGVTMQHFICDKTSLSPGESTFCSDLIGVESIKNNMIAQEDRVEIEAWFNNNEANRGVVTVTCAEPEPEPAPQPAAAPAPAPPQPQPATQQPSSPAEQEAMQETEPESLYSEMAVPLGIGLGSILLIIIILAALAYKTPAIAKRYRHICPMDHSVMATAGKVKVGPRGGYRTVYLCPKCNYKTLAGEHLVKGEKSRKCPLCESKLQRDGEISTGPRGGKRRVYVCKKCKYQTMLDEDLSSTEMKKMKKKR